MREPVTSREALIAEILGELDGLLTRSEELPKTLAEGERRLVLAAQILEKAGLNYRLAVTSFTDEAKTALTEHARDQLSEVATLAAELQRKAVYEAVRVAVQRETSEFAVRLDAFLNQRGTVAQRVADSNLRGHGLTALVSSVLTAALLLWVETFS
ncbi:hypothetical protein [Massilia sp. H6]|uniref:hypothetical protein n=1 Tax=Massilia sp. H6 TaxID=2970464 RepID=UPI0021692BC0|nr:hypothetical protein [Massilia sp. H6]UVW30673.1 hypothetical protein NRS07_20130 [Massilia sp. H6]